MTSKQPLNDRQVTTLKWIADGCPDGRWTDTSYKTTCYALGSRGLAVVDRRPESWSAEITEAGAYYLEHRRFPGMTLLDLRVRADAAGVRRYVAASAAEYAAAIMGELDARRGEPIELERAGRDYSVQDVVAAAVRSPWRPVGKKLAIKQIANGRERRYLAQYELDLAEEVTRQEVSVPKRVPELHPVASAYRDDVDRHEVSKTSLGRACRIVHALATEAEKRGHAIENTTRPRSGYSDFRSNLTDGQLAITVGDHAFALRLTEVSDSGGPPVDYVKVRSLPRWYSTKTSTFVPTGRLSIALTGWASRSGRKEKFSDGKRSTLEAQLGELLWELEVRSLERDEEAKEKARAAEVRRTEWERAVDEATVRMAQAHRASQLQDRAAEWAEFVQLRNYVTALRDRIEVETRPEPGALEWLRWAEDYVAARDPLQEQPIMPTPPEPTDENMRPHLRGWTLREP